MAMPEFTLRQLLEAGVHFGHHTRRWNPRMGPYLYGVRNQVHIIDLQQTVPLLDRALRAVRDVTAAGGRVLLVGTKRAAAEYVAEAAKRCGQYYVNHRWLGGTLTNWKTITGSIKRLRQIEELLAGDTRGLTKKEVLEITRDHDKLERALGGIKEMGGLPDILFIIDTNKEKLAVEEANKLHIPVVAILDSNSDPTGVTYPVPGQRRRDPRDHAVLRPGVRRGAGRDQRRDGGLGRRYRRGREPASGSHAGRRSSRRSARLTGGANHAGDHRCPGEGPAREDRRRHDGLQEGADRDRRRRGSRGGLAAQEGAGRRGQALGPRRRRGAGRRRLRAAGCAAMVEVNAETDFVARNEQFQAFVEAVAKLALTVGDDIEAIKAAQYPDSAVTVAEHLTQLVATIGENITLRRAKRLSVPDGVVATYVHAALRPGLGKIGVLVAVQGAGELEVLETLGRQMGMHIAASPADGAGHRRRRSRRAGAREGDPDRAGAAVRPPGQHHREDGRRPHPQVLRGSGAAGAGLGA